MDLRLNLMAGIDIPVPECQLIIHQPTVKEIAWLGEEAFFSGVQCLTVSKKLLIRAKTYHQTYQIFKYL